jgi:hypothetical protein
MQRFLPLKRPLFGRSHLDKRTTNRHPDYAHASLHIYSLIFDLTTILSTEHSIFRPTTRSPHLPRLQTSILFALLRFPSYSERFISKIQEQNRSLHSISVLPWYSSSAPFLDSPNHRTTHTPYPAHAYSTLTLPHFDRTIRTTYLSFLRTR